MAGVAAAGVLAAAASPAASPQSAATRCAGPYAYAGVAGGRPARGVAATLTARTPARLAADGQVAAWVGVGGRGLGPGGRDSWIQAGLVAFGSGRIRIYQEITRPGRRPVYTEVAADVAVGEPRRVAVASAGRDRWVVLVDGRRVAGPVRLPGSGSWRPVATAESWVRGSAGCNRLDFRFERVRVADGAGWRPLTRHVVIQDRGYGVVRLAPASFVAIARP